MTHINIISPDTPEFLIHRLEETQTALHLAGLGLDFPAVIAINEQLRKLRKQSIGVAEIPVYPFNILDRECLQTAEKFDKWVETRCIVDYDGIAHLAIDLGVTKIHFKPSEWYIYKTLGLSHVCWYNR